MNSPVGSWVDVPCENRDAAPSSRSHSAGIVYKDGLYVFGGRDGSTPLNDFHEFSFSRGTWGLVPATGDVPRARSGHTCVVHKESVYVFGGYDGHSHLNDLMEYNFRKQKWTVVVANAGCEPSPRSDHSAVVYGNSMYCFGGYSGSAKLNDIYKFNFNKRTWAPVHAKGPVPQARRFASLVVFENTGILFGGLGDSGSLNDLHTFDFSRRAWSMNVVDGPEPTPRHGHVAVIHSNAMYVFGGFANRAMDDFLKLPLGSSEKRHWQQVTFDGASPCPCAFHTAAVYDSSLIVFDGRETEGNTNKVIQFRFEKPRKDSAKAIFARLYVEKNTLTPVSFSPRNAPSSQTEKDEVAKLRNEVNQLRIELQENAKDNKARGDELHNELNQFRIELREDMKALRGAVQHEPTKLCKRLVTETVTQLAEIQNQSEHPPMLRPVDSHLVELCRCPLSMRIMRDSVLTPSGVTYERDMIEQHLDHTGAFDPTTGAPLTKAELYPNRAIKDLIEKHFQNSAH